MLGEEDPGQGHVLELAEVAELVATRQSAIACPTPRLSEPALSDPVGKLGAAVGLSARSVIRLFPRETSLSFRQWHNQAKLLRAFELFDEGHNVTRVALELGYSSASAFTKMFRRTLGRVPTPNGKPRRRGRARRSA